MTILHGPPLGETSTVPPKATPTTGDGSPTDFLDGGGQMGAAIRRFDWAATPLGNVVLWPQSLRTVVTIMLASPHPVVLFWGPDLRLLYNDAFCSIFGDKHPQTLGTRANEAMHEEWERLGPLVAGVMSSGKALYVQNGCVVFERLPGGRKEEGYFTWSYVPARDEANEICGLFTIVAETTSQVVGERRLRVIHELSIRASLDRSVKDVFRSVGEVLGGATKDIPFSLLYVQEGNRFVLAASSVLEPGSLAAPYDLGLSDSGPWQFATVIAGQPETVANLNAREWPDQSWQLSATSAVMMPLPYQIEGNAAAVLITGVNPLRPLDDDYRSFLQLVAGQIAASVTSARADEQQKQRAEALAKIERAKDSLLPTVSQELHTPLTSSLGPVQDAVTSKSQNLDDAELALVRRNALRLYRTANSLLDFSRLESQPAAVVAPIDLSAHTAELAGAFRSTIEGMGVRFSVHCAPLPAVFHADSEMWEKVVLNLLSNAIKYTHEGSIEVNLSWDAPHAVLTVVDTGVGITTGNLPRIFDRFYRSAGSTVRFDEGAGIGLAVVKEMVEAHGGSVSATSMLGSGSTFTVRLPSCADDSSLEGMTTNTAPLTTAMGVSAFVEEALTWYQPRAPLPPNVGPDAAPEVPPELASARILVADDNADLRVYVTRLLGRMFRNVEAVADGAAALEAARKDPPDLILSDTKMPGLDGLGLVKQLRADERTRNVPVVLLAARDVDEPKSEGLDQIADDYLMKPFSPRELIARVRNQLEMSNIRRQVNERTILAEQLSEAVKMREDWVVLFAHELRTPVTSALFAVESLLRVANPAEQQSKAAPSYKSVQSVVVQVTRLARLVQQLVDATELLSGQFVLQREQVEVAEQMTLIVRETLRLRPHVTLNLTTNGPVVGYYDPDRVRRVIELLLDNALRFGAGKPVTLTLHGQPELFTLVVTDHGPGVPKQSVAGIFERFRRGGSASTNEGGLGLGLWLAREIIEAHDGHISLSSTAGGGATFKVELPRAAG